MYAEIICPQCKAEAKVDQINLDHNRATCHICNLVYPIDQALELIRNKVRVQLPEHWESSKSINHMHLSIPWNTNAPAAFQKVRGCFEAITIIPGVIAFAFICFWVVGFTIQSIERNETLNLIVGLLFSIGGLALLFWLYFTRKRRSHTTISVDDKSLKINLPTLHKSDSGKTQFPIQSNSTISKSEVKQLYVIKNGPLYNVVLVDHSDTLHHPFYPFFNLDHALYVEQSIEDLLRIKDKSTDEEIKI